MRDADRLLLRRYVKLTGKVQERDELIALYDEIPRKAWLLMLNGRVIEARKKIKSEQRDIAKWQKTVRRVE